MRPPHRGLLEGLLRSDLEGLAGVLLANVMEGPAPDPALTYLAEMLLAADQACDILCGPGGLSL